MDAAAALYWLWNTLYVVAVLLLGAGLCVMAYLDRVYRELGRVATGRVRDNLEIFEREVEPQLNLERRRASLYFTLLAQLWLVLVAVVTAGGVSLFNQSPWQRAAEMVVFLTLEVALGMYFVPHVLLTRTTGRWVRPLVPVIKLFVWAVWPVRAGLDLAVSLLHLGDERAPGEHPDGQEGIEALVEAAEEDGILRPGEADLIEQVVEFSDKRVHEVMTPRPEIVAIPADATIEQLRRLVVETRYSRIPVYEGSLDDIVGVAFARDVLQVPESEAPRRTVRELMRPALFVPETKLGSQLLREFQQKNQQMAVVVDEYGSVAGVVTAEDLVEEIIGEIGEEDRAPVPDAVRESDGALLLRGSVSLEKAGELLGAELDREMEDAPATVAGLVNRIAGRVPAAGETLDFDGFRFEVLEANQRKVLRLRVVRKSAEARSAPES
jgi:CBS domain containing-hemolysin-like protein